MQVLFGTVSPHSGIIQQLMIVLSLFQIIIVIPAELDFARRLKD